MTLRQKLLKIFYPFLMRISRKKENAILENKNAVKPLHSFYDLTAIANNGQLFSFASLKGYNVLLVNTASNCGYTNQYSALETLSKNYGKQLKVIGFPSNDFKEQEKGSDEEIASFCKINYGVTFPLMRKSVVVKKEDQHPVFQWLSAAAENGWNEQAPAWNFSKYLINSSGILTHYFSPSVDPLDKEIVDHLKSDS